MKTPACLAAAPARIAVCAALALLSQATDRPAWGKLFKDFREVPW